MTYQTARKLHNGDEVIVKRTRSGKSNVPATVHRVRDDKRMRTIELSLFMPGGELDVYTHIEVT